MKCNQCGKPAVITYEEGKIAFCLDCNLKYQQAQEMIIRRNAEMLNYLTGQIESSFGMYGMFPRYQITDPVYKQGDMTLNNININNSNVGAINTGNVKSIDVNLSVMKSQGEIELSELIRELTEKLIGSNQLTVEDKSEVLEQISFISEQVCIPPDQRKNGLLKTNFATIPAVISKSKELLEIWEKIEPLLS